MKEQEILLAADFEEAFLGVGWRVGLPKLAIYSIPRAVTILEARGMDRLEARELLYEQSQTVDMGELTPLWVEEMTVQELNILTGGGEDRRVH
jgi:hypothetical protein